MASEQAGVTTRIVGAPDVERSDEILTPEALAFVAALQRRFGARRDELLAARRARREEVARTGTLDFLTGTHAVRTDAWSVAGAPADLRDRRVEITGPPTPKMAINALNSGAKVWLADLEDASTPHWRNVVGGQVVLRDATRRSLAFTSPEGKEYALRSDAPLAVMVVRPRGWHLDDVHVEVDGVPAVGALVDFGLHFFHNAAELLARGSGPYYYLPKIESHLEARLWNDVFTDAQEALGVPHGTVRATVLIETIPAAFEMEEILYELREHASGLNAGRWDYLFSMIKYFRDSGPSFTLPDRGAITMTAPFMRAYTELLVATCHRRGAFAMGGMAAVIPNRRDREVTAQAFAKVRADKQREAGDGFDGSWVAHPDLVPVCEEVFDDVLGERANQLDRLREEVHVSAAELLDVASASGDVTEEGLRNNLYVSVAYVAAWLDGNGAVAIHHLMEDAATAEISRSQVWQWVHSGARFTAGGSAGEPVTADLVRTLLGEETARLRDDVGHEVYDAGSYAAAAALVESIALDDDYIDVLTLPAYDLVVAAERAAGAREGE